MGKLNQTIIDNLFPYGQFGKHEIDIHNQWAKDNYVPYTPCNVLNDYEGVARVGEYKLMEQYALHSLEQARAILFELKRRSGEYTGECQQAVFNIENAINHLTHRITRRALLGKNAHSSENSEEQLRIVANSDPCDLRINVNGEISMFCNVYPQVMIPKCIALLYYIKRLYLYSSTTIDFSIEVADEDTLHVDFNVVNKFSGQKEAIVNNISDKRMVGKLLNRNFTIEEQVIKQYIADERDDVQIALIDINGKVQCQSVPLPETVTRNLTGEYKRTVLFKLIRVISEYFEQREDIMLFGNPKCDTILFGFGKFDNIEDLRNHILDRAEFITPFAGGM